MRHPILARVESLGFAVFTDGDWNLNIIGIRKRLESYVDRFDDALHCIYKEKGRWVDRWWPITTDPGLHYLMSADKQLNPAGTAVLIPDQYRGVYKIDKHGKSRYDALCQRNGTVSVWRDDNHDEVVDYEGSESSGYFGINIHASSSSPYRKNRVANRVGVWSAGCQVFQDTQHFREFMKICNKQRSERGWDSFTYTLMDEW